MWKVKRMNTARIVVLTIAVGAGGLAACPANGSDNTLSPTDTIHVAGDGVSRPTTTQT
jgi:pilus assembly protein CpaB